MNTIIENFLQHLKIEKRYSLLTIAAYGIDLKEWLQFMNENAENDSISINEINYQLLRGYLLSLSEKKLKASSIARKTSTLKAFFKYAVSKKLISDNPARNLTAPKKPKRLPQFIDDTQAGQLYSHESETQENITDELIIILLYEAGLRRAELINLKCKDVDYAKKTLWVTGKGNKQRMIPISKLLIEKIMYYLGKKQILTMDSNNNLLTLKSGKALYPMYVERVVKRQLSQVTTLAQKSPHTLRHSFATTLYNNGANLIAIKELLGHSSLAATQVYMHSNIEKLKTIFQQTHPRASQNGQDEDAEH